jgi:hypothetical protein
MFLALQDGETLHYGGTAFIASVSAEGGRYCPYVVTARHNIDLAKRSGGRLVARFNVEGGSELLDLSKAEVITPEDEGVDLAVIAQIEWPKLLDGGRMRHLALAEMAATADFISANHIGVGTQVFATGLFAARRGESQNLPVGRTGTIAAMPTELDHDEWSGVPYRAYLVDVTSIAGLSGAPVYVLTPPKFSKSEEEGWYLDQQLRLLGLIRGHWNYRPESSAIDFDNRVGELIHTGIAIVTPVDALVELLNREDVRRDRERAISGG